MSQTSTSQRRPHVLYAGLLILLTLVMSLPGLFSIPVIDRDEARYAQATVQMVESGDYLNIRFQDRARNKKPAGIYWMQAGSVKALTDKGERKIGAHRIPSVIGAVIAVLATYWGSYLIIGRRGAFLAGAILGTAALFVFEAHIAKTDAMLCAMSAVVLASLLHLRHRPTKLAAILLWAALALGVMIKGPIVPALLLLTIFGLAVWERDISWLAALKSPIGIILAALIILPWAVLIGIETNGAFYREAFGGDLAPKLVGGQEKHGAPPGYYLATLPILFWPGTLFLLAGLVFGVQASRQKSEDNAMLASAARLLLMWILPFWILLEIVPTKLPNYLLPVYPALAILIGGALTAMLQIKVFKISRRLGAVLFLIISIALLITVLSAEAAYADQQSWAKWIIPAFVIIAFYVFGTLWAGKTGRALIGGGMAALGLSFITYHIIMPKLDAIYVSRNIDAALTAAAPESKAQNARNIFSPQFTEPSLVYRLGTQIKLGDKTDTIMAGELPIGAILLMDTSRDEVKTQLQSLRAAECFENLGAVKGVNYSKGDAVNIDLLKVIACQLDAVTVPVDPSEQPEATPVQE